MARLQKFWLPLCWLMFVLSTGYAAWLGFEKPFRNWDMVAYVGSAVQWGAPDTQAMYDTTMADIKRVIWPEYYKDITETGILSNDPESFRQQMPFYQVKPLYIGGVWLLEKFSTGYVEGTWRIAAVSLIALMALLAFFQPASVNRGVWLIAISCFLWMGQWELAALARYSTPDSLATALSVAALYYVLKKKSLPHFIAFGILGTWARPDVMLLMVMTAVTMFCARELTRKQALIAIGAFLAGYAAVQLAAGGYGWQKLFYYTFIDKLARPEETVTSFGIGKYLDIVFFGISRVTYDARLIPMLALSAFALFCHVMRPGAPKLWLWVMALAWGSYAVRFVLYPNWWESRYYFIHHMMALVASAELMPPYLLAVKREFLRHRERVNS